MESSVRLVLFLPALGLSLAACSGSMEEKLAEVLGDVASSVTITDTHVEAACSDEAKTVAKVDVAELGLDALGMTEVENLQNVAKSLRSKCEAGERQKAKDEADQKTLRDEAKKMKLKIAGAADADTDTLRTAVCEAKKKKLPFKGERRDDLVNQNRVLFGCPDPGEPEIPPTGYWQIEDKKGVDTIKLDADDDDRGRARLVLRCNKKKAEGYISTTEKLHKRKNKRVAARVNGKKRKWKMNPSKDGKAVFFDDAKAAAKSMRKGKTLMLKLYPRRGKSFTKTFQIEGFDKAIAPLRKACRF